jgi:hypothetical protein
VQYDSLASAATATACGLALAAASLSVSRPSALLTQLETNTAGKISMRKPKVMATVRPT